MACFTALRSRFGVYCAVTRLAGGASIRFRELTQFLSRPRLSAQMTPAIYHKIVAASALGTGCREIVRPTGILFGRNSQS
jgi:hypothetical protein